MQHTNFTLTKPNGQPRKPRNQAEFRSVYIADLAKAAEANGVTLTNVPQLPIRRPTSRTGRKSMRKSFDADCRRLRREAGAPARTGPPIPGSEKTGHRRFYTLEQQQRGTYLSGISRKDQATPTWERIQQLHYRRCSIRAIARQVGLSGSQVHRVIAGRLWGADGERIRAPSVVVHSVKGTPHTWARVLALQGVYLSRCEGDAKVYKWLTTRQAAYQKGIIKNRGADDAAAIVEATDRYVRSLASLDVAMAVKQVNLDSGYQPAAGTYRGATYGQPRWPFSTACEDGGS